MPFSLQHICTKAGCSVWILVFIITVYMVFVYIKVPFKNNQDASLPPKITDNQLQKQQSVVYPPGLIPLAGLAHAIIINESTQADVAEATFYKFWPLLDVECGESERLGAVGDGGWDMCVVPPYKPAGSCLVYSFGISNDFTFDDAISRQHGCQVRSFDPSMKKTEHQHSANVTFYPIGLAGKNHINTKGWKMMTLSNLMLKFSDNNRILDYLKFDIEGNEWQVLPNLYEEGILRQVKQIGFEVHTHQVTNVKSFSSSLALLKKMWDYGFKKWYHHSNMFCMFESNKVHKSAYTRCHELVYINSRFL